MFSFREYTSTPACPGWILCKYILGTNIFVDISERFWFCSAVFTFMIFVNWFRFQWHQFWLKYMRMQLQQWLFCASKLLTLAFPLCWAVLCYKSSQIRDTTPWKTMEKELDGCCTIISELLHHTRPGLWHGCVLIYIWLSIFTPVSCLILDDLTSYDKFR